MPYLSIEAFHTTVYKCRKDYPKDPKKVPRALRYAYHQYVVNFKASRKVEKKEKAKESREQPVAKVAKQTKTFADLFREPKLTSKAPVPKVAQNALRRNFVPRDEIAAELAMLRAANARLLNRAETAERAVKETNVLLRKAVEEVQLLTNSNRKTITKLDNVKADLKASIGRNSALKAEISNRLKHDVKRTTKATKDKLVKSLREKLETSSIKIETIQIRLDEVTACLKAERTKKGAFASTSTAVEQATRTLSTELTAKNQEIDSLRTMFRTISDKHDEVVDDYETLSRKVIEVDSGLVVPSLTQYQKRKLREHFRNLP